MLRKKRILHLLTSMSAGGAQTNLLALLRHFDKEKYEHFVAFGGDYDALGDEFVAAGATLLQISPAPLGVKAMFNKSKMIAKIAGVSPDVMHSHLDLPNLLGLAAKRRLGLRLVIHLHGLGLVPHKKLPGRPFKHRLWNLLAHGYRKCDRVIAICSFQLPFLQDLGFPREQVVLIPNGITLDVAEAPGRSAREEYTFVNVARFFPQKDHDTLLRAFASVYRRKPNVRLLLVGDGPLRGEVEQQARALGLQDAVRFLGVRRDIPDILARSDCFVLSSRWELHPITILEAMRAGLPVVATGVGGIGDTVIDRESGYITEPENDAALADAMLRVATDPQQSMSMGATGFALVKDRFNNAKVAKQIEDVYAEVLSLP